MSEEMQLKLTKDVWENLSALMNSDLLQYYIENIEDLEDRLLQTSIAEEDPDLFGGADNILIILNCLRRMKKNFESIQGAVIINNQ